MLLANTDCALTKKLRAKGYDVVHRPLISLIPKAAVAPPRLENYQLVVCVSRYAAYCFLRLFRRARMQLPRQLPPFFAPGKTTATYLMDKGISTLYPLEGTGSEAILNMPEWNNLCQKKNRALILCGEDGRQILSIKLKQMGQQVDRMILYKHKPIICHYEEEDAESRRQAFSLVWVTSGHILCSLMKQDYPWLRAATLVVPSRRLADLAQQQGIKSSKIVVLRDGYDSTFMDYVKGRTEIKKDD